MPGHDLALLIDAAKASGEIAMRYWKQSPKVWEKPGEGPVTEADIAVNDMLHNRLRTACPSYGWLSEETPDTDERLDCEHLFLIDPIDGTSAFIAEDSSFSHSFAVAQNGIVTAAVVYLPAKDRLYAATLNGPATCNGQPIHCSNRAGIVGATLLTPKATLAPDLWTEVPDVTRHFRASVAYRLCLVADGAFDGMISLRQAWEWDIGAGALIADRAGATVTNRLGAPLHFNAELPRSNGILVATPGLHCELLARLKP
ncbi:MAG: 3'(2'),5'-bisphosphate nucleotidase CysQ [Paracoccaceae bacterium]